MQYINYRDEMPIMQDVAAAGVRGEAERNADALHGAAPSRRKNSTTWRRIPTRSTTSRTSPDHQATLEGDDVRHSINGSWIRRIWAKCRRRNSSSAGL